ncbi:MFS superfamily sulfate permease-like transporter [Aquimarina sp. MAR_2010_214]|uniref:SulP family inorganic anion transporter n=1 Tax=Aquimarina sp. MAR_2010_214 TaxID=1250026 RepID=UPI000CC53DBD|nr:SulP family inorganic anion transporter [Aquimarina sp. MAR_2010_214]PKV52892.1 MFS superfamily sulfate permease-like transporter [Aquimarina sp. MAR_2010_214]
MKAINDLTFVEKLKHDIPASIVVFLVAMPLCLGIALASGAPLFSGIIGGIIGGIVVGSLSGSSLGVSGPAAGLTVIVLNGITDLGGFQFFLVALVIAGILQTAMGYLKAGVIAYYFPSSVIHGMLAGIGLIIIIKQFPNIFGYIAPEGGLASPESFLGIFDVLNYVSLGVIIITMISLFILIFWETKFIKNLKYISSVPGPLVAVIVGVLLNKAFAGIPYLSIASEHVVSLPITDSLDSFLGNFTVPDFSALVNPQIYITAIILAVVGSLETLLSVEAIDKQDSLKRITPTNKELKAQGIGNMISGLIGGLPVTQVIVRSSVNQQSGGKTKASAILHGVLLLISVVLIPTILNLIPLATLAAILLTVGYKLAKPVLFKKMLKQGPEQFVPFVVTVVGIVATDLLMGIAMGMMVSVFSILRNNYKVPFKGDMKKAVVEKEGNFKLELSEDVTFLNKASIQKSLMEIPENTSVEICALNSHFLHPDVFEIIKDFEENAKEKNIDVSLINVHLHCPIEKNKNRKNRSSRKEKELATA